jgi:hypothetical protein
MPPSRLNRSVRKRGSTQSHPASRRRSKARLRKSRPRAGAKGEGGKRAKRARDAEPAILHLTEDEYSEMDMPKHFSCPITHTGMIDPVVASDGHTYERVAIERWGQERPPKTHIMGAPIERKPDGTPLVFNNRALREAIEDFCMRGTEKLAPEIQVPAIQVPAAAPAIQVPAAAPAIQVPAAAPATDELWSNFYTLMQEALGVRGGFLSGREATMARGRELARRSGMTGEDARLAGGIFADTAEALAPAGRRGGGPRSRSRSRGRRE